MARGHGTLGLLDRLRTFADLAEAGSEVSRRPYLELRLGLLLTGWAASGSNWTRTVTAAELTFAGVIRPIVGAASLIFPRELTRVEQAADVVAGTWFIDDAAIVAGGSTTMTVRLPTATDPDDTSAGLVVQLLFTFGGGDDAGNAEVHPLLGVEKLLNSDLENWSGGNPTDWSEAGAGTATVQETTIVKSGLSSAKIGGSLGPSAFEGIFQNRSCIAGAFYRSSGYYLTPDGQTSGVLEVRLEIGRTGEVLLNDGSSLTATTEGFRLADTQGEWRRFLFDWRANTTANQENGIFIKNTTGSGVTGFVYVDRMSWRRIWRWNLYANNLSASAIPELSIQSQSINFGPKTIGFGSVTLLDGDGELAKALASLLVLQKPAQVYVGGSFRNGDEIHREDWRGVFPGLIRKPEISPGQITLELENAKTLTVTKAPERSYKLTGDLTTMARSQEALPKPLMFGIPLETGGATFQHIVPGVRVAQDASTLYGHYEDLDPTVPVRDGVDRDLPASYSIKVFPNKDLADRNLQGYVITDSTNDFDVTNNKTRYRILRDIRNYRYDHAGNDVGVDAAFWFTTEAGSGTVVARITVEGPAYKVAADLQAAMRTAVGGGDTAMLVTYSETTHKFTVARSGSKGIVLSLLMTDLTGQREAHKKSYALLGYDTKQDLTGATTYTGDHATFTDPDVDHVIRFPGGGYKDDAAGSICGAANAAIDSGPAIASWTLQKRYNVPATSVDVASSFKDARNASRSTDFAIMFATFDEEQGDEILGICERVTVASIFQDGEGMWRCIKHAAGTAGARTFYDADYIEGSWRMWLDPTAVFKALRILADWNPSLKRFMTYADGASVIDPYIPIKHGEERVLEIPSYIDRHQVVGGTQLISNYYGRLIGKIPRVVQFEATSKLVDLLPGHKVILNRSGRGVLDPTGALTSTAFRIVDLTHRYSTTGISRCVAVEDVTFLT